MTVGLECFGLTHHCQQSEFLKAHHVLIIASLTESSVMTEVFVLTLAFWTIMAMDHMGKLQS